MKKKLALKKGEMKGRKGISLGYNLDKIKNKI
jgi:hypothetical protein